MSRRNGVCPINVGLLRRIPEIGVESPQISIAWPAESHDLISLALQKELDVIYAMLNEAAADSSHGARDAVLIPGQNIILLVNQVLLGATRS